MASFLKSVTEIYHIEGKLSNFCFFDMDMLCIYNLEVFLNHLEMINE